MTYEEIGVKIRETRRAKGIGMEELGQRIGLGYSSMSRLETGHVKRLDVDILQKVASALEVPISTFQDPEAAAPTPPVAATYSTEPDGIKEPIRPT